MSPLRTLAVAFTSIGVSVAVTPVITGGEYCHYNAYACTSCNDSSGFSYCDVPRTIGIGGFCAGYSGTGECTEHTWACGTSRACIDGEELGGCGTTPYCEDDL